MPLLHDINRHVCSCGNVMRVVKNLTGTRAPRTGDRHLCLECGNVLIYDGDSLRQPTTAEYDVLQRDDRLKRLQGRRERERKKFNWQKRRSNES